MKIHKNKYIFLKQVLSRTWIQNIRLIIFKMPKTLLLIQGSSNKLQTQRWNITLNWIHERLDSQQKKMLFTN